jgi:CBS domain-containing protein
MDRSYGRRGFENGRRDRDIHTEDTLPQIRRTPELRRMLDGGRAPGPEWRQPSEPPWRQPSEPWPRDPGPRAATGGDARRAQDGPPGHQGWWQREPLTAMEIMTTDPKAVPREASLVEAAASMRTANVGVLPVVDRDHRLVGLVTDRDIVVRGCASGRPVADLRVSDVMSQEVAAVRPHDPVRRVLEVMGDERVRRVPVVDEEGRLLGLVSIADIASRADYDRELQEAFERIASRRSFWSRVWR